MKFAAVTALAIALPVALSAGATVNFDDQEIGNVPTGWTATMTGQGTPQWTVEDDASAPSAPKVLKQSGTAAFPLCVKDDTSLADGFLELKFKPLTGEEDQAAGIVWRYSDPKNYYIMRANALEDNVVLYKVEKGKRSSLNIVGRAKGYGVDVVVPNGQWQNLRVEFTGDLFTVILEGTELFQVKDQTFTEAGKVGLWTKADSVILFDDFRYGAID